MNIRLIIIGLLIPSIVSSDVTVAKLFSAAEFRYGLPKGVLAAIAQVESGTNVTAIKISDGFDKKTSYGLMQIKLDTANFIGPNINAQQLMDPEININRAAAYLKWLLNRSGHDLALALSCYNAGPNSLTCRSKLYSQYVGLVLNAWASANR